MLDRYRRSYRAAGRSLAIALAAFLTFAASPIPQPAQTRQPRAAEQHQPEPEKHAEKNSDGGNRVPGSIANSPLYVKAACEHGCGYAENRESWGQRLWTDPIATFTALLALLTIFLAFATIRAANAAKKAADLVPALERAYIFVEIDSLSFSRGRDNTRTYDIFYKVSNFGKTPAVLKEISAKGSFQFAMTAPEYDLNRLDQELVLLGLGDEVGAETNAPHAFATKSYAIQRCNVPVTPEMEGGTVALKDGKTFMWLSGRVVYDDVFGREHITPFWFRNQEGGTGLRPHGGSKFHKRT